MAKGKMRLAINGKTLKQAAMVAGVTGVGAVAAKVGGRIATRLSAGVAKFAATNANNNAVVEAGAGLVLDAGILLAVAKLSKGGTAKAAKMAPFMAGGTILAAVAPVVAGKVVDGVTGIFDKVLPAAGGFYANPYQGLAGELPAAGGLYGEPALGLAGELPMAGGLASAFYGNGARIPGELM